MQRRAFLASVAGFIAARFAPADQPRIGTTITVKKPPRYIVPQGEDIAMALRVVSHFDVASNTLFTRFDMVYGFGRPDAELNQLLIDEVIQKMLVEARVIESPQQLEAECKLAHIDPNDVKQKMLSASPSFRQSDFTVRIAG